MSPLRFCLFRGMFCLWESYNLKVEGVSWEEKVWKIPWGLEKLVILRMLSVGRTQWEDGGLSALRLNERAHKRQLDV